MTTKTEAKNRNLRIVIDFMNAEFVRSGKQDREAAYLVRLGLSLKGARAIQETLLAAHRSGNVTPLLDGVMDHASVVEWVPSKDGRGFEMLQNISGAERILYVALVNVINSGRFWSLRRCAECLRFFPGWRKKRYCSDTCIRSHESKTAQERTERARRTRRFKEVFPQLLKLQKAAKGKVSAAVDMLPGFDPKLLALIVESKTPLKELVSQVKYRNRKILMGAKL